jgi:hypothetical protein
MKNKETSRKPNRRLRENLPGEWAKSMGELASRFSVSRVTILRWLRRGAPAANASGFYPIELWAEWVEQHGKDVNSEDDLDKSRLTARQISLKNQKLELELQQKRGELIHRDEVRMKLYQTFDTCRRLQLKLGSSLAARLSGMNPAQIKAEIDEAISQTYRDIRAWAEEEAKRDAQQCKEEQSVL